MTIELKIGQLNTSTASDGDLLSYVGANGVVEYRDIVSEIDARISSNVNTVQDNVTAVDNNTWVNANDFATYTTVTGLINTVQANLTSVIAAAPTTLDTLAEIAAALENDANLAVTLTNQIGTVSDNAATNTTNINTVQENVASLDATITANTYNTYTTLTANLYNTYTNLSSDIDGVQANLYAVTLDTVVTNGNTTTQSIEVAGLNASADLTVSGPTELNSNVTINGMIDSVDRIQFNTLINTDTTAGMVAWNYDYGTVSVGLDDSTYVKIGQDVYYYVKAGEALSAGDVLYASGTVGGSGNIEASKYIANSSIDAKYVIGIATSSIASGEFGYASVIGTIHHINASGSSAGETWLEGDVLYASPTTRGGLTKTLPEAPNQDIPIAFVTSNNASSGALAVRATALGYKLGELHDVYSGVESDGDVLTWISANARWEPKATEASSLSASIDLVQDNVGVVGASLDSFGLYANSTFALSNEAVTFADLSVANLVVEGDMTIIGDTTTIESNNVVITNPYLLLNNGVSGANTLDAGIVIDRGSSANVGLLWDEDSDSFTFITTDDGIEQTELTPTGNASIVVGGFSINDIAFDITTNAPADGQTLVYVAANSAFEPGIVSSESSNLISDQYTVSTSNIFTLTSSVVDANNILVSLDGIIQNPNDDYAVSGTTLSINNTAPLPSGIEVEVRHLPTSGGSGSGGGGSSETWEIVSSNQTLSAGTNYFIAANSAITVTLPSSPTLGNQIRIVDLYGTAGINTITVARNAQKIQRLAEDLEVTTNSAAFALVFSNSDNGWLFTET